MEYPISDMIDRLSIIKLKMERTTVDHSQEYKIFRDDLLKQIDEETLDSYLEPLYEVNGYIWDLEAQLRMGREEQLGLEEVGRRALKIRDFNAERVALKNEIVKLTGTGFVEKKINHASEERNQYAIHRGIRYENNIRKD